MFNRPDENLQHQLLVLTKRITDLEDQLRGHNGFEASRPVCCILFHSAVQVISTGGWNVLQFDTEQYDTDVMHDNAVNNSRITIKTAGYYLIGGGCGFEVSTGGTIRELGLRRGGATFEALVNDANHAAGVIAPFLGISKLVWCDASNYFELVVYQDSGGNINTNRTANYSPIFWAIRQP